MGQPTVADRYISPGGRTPAYNQRTWAEDLMTLSDFLVWAEDDGAFYAGHRAQDAFAAMCRLLDVDGVKLRKIMRGEG